MENGKKGLAEGVLGTRGEAAALGEKQELGFTQPEVL